MAQQEQTLVLIKPDGINRGIIGEIIHRFERKGLKIAALKMVKLNDKILEEHYFHHKNKPFFKDLKDFMQLSPTVIMILEGNHAVSIVRTMAGPTSGFSAPPGTIRGDYSSSISHNVVHASEDAKQAKIEIKRFFKSAEIFSYKKIDWEAIYAVDERL